MESADFEKMVGSLLCGWWGEKHMSRELWAFLLGARAALHAAGYRVDSGEYQALCLLLDIHHDIMGDIQCKR